MSQIPTSTIAQPKKRLNSRQITFLIFVVSLHTLPVVAIFTGARLVDGLVCIGFSMIYAFGLGGGLHRYFVPRGFKTSRALQFFMCLFSRMTFRDPICVVGKHRHH